MGDYETFCELDITSAGVSRYVRDPSLEIILTSWSLDEGETIKQHDLYADGDRLPNEYLDALEDERIQKIFWNAPFEINVTREALGIDIPVETVTDPMVVARSLSMPGKLSEACRILNLPESEWKHKGGKALINLFCKPRKPTPKNPSTRNTAFTHPEKWEKFRRYNVADIKAMAGCWFRMKRWNLSDEEWELWEYDRQVNEAGVPVNLRAIDNANKIVDTLTAKSLDELTRITKLENANSGPQLLGWLKERDYPFNDLKVGHVKRALKEAIAVGHVKRALKEAIADGDGDTKYATALRRRTEISKASIKKFAAYDEMVNDDGLLRNTILFNGAGRTCRFSSTGVQVHNMARPHAFFEKGETQEALARAVMRMDPDLFAWVYSRPNEIDAFEALSSAVRGVIAAPPGYVFVSADFNAIENRVLGYMADEQKILDVFLNDRCPYVDFATYMFGGTYENLWHEYKVLKQKMKRQIAKPGVLGCGYMLGPGHEYEDPSTGEMLATGLLGYGRNMGIDLTPEQSAKSVEVWRATYSKVSDYDDGLWHNLDHAARKTIETGRRTSVNMIDFEKDGPFLTMRLPSGRKLYYIRPRIEERKMPWGDMRPSITYEGIDSRSQRKVWGRITAHPGKITENLDQALARDCLANALLRLKRRNVNVVNQRLNEPQVDVRLHVHDEILALAREEDAERVGQVISEAMSESPEWAPGLPLKAVAEISKVFVKT
jgi:DNA polymerase